MVDGKEVREHPAVILPIAPLADFNAVEDAAASVQTALEASDFGLGVLGQAAFMAVSELCGNSVEHGRNPLGGYIAAMHLVEPRPRLTLAIADLGVGIPDHIRRLYPDWSDDSFCIAQAMNPHVTGTGDPHRGIGFDETFQAALVSALAAAQMDVVSSNGFVRAQVVQERIKHEFFPPPRRKQGTWIQPRAGLASRLPV
jgi:anti-sigma regulatory factor (Ser/Thr protein kinase)